MSPSATDSEPSNNSRPLLLVRHAQTVQDSRVASSDWNLSAGASESCKQLAAALSGFRIDRVLTSTEGKARHTGSLLANQLGTAVQSVNGLQEHDRTGGQFIPHDEWNATIERFFHEPTKLVFGKESADEALERFEEAVRRQVAEHPQEAVVLVSHGTVLALFIAKHNRLDALALWRTIQMPEAFVLELPDFKLSQRITPTFEPEQD